MTEVSNSLRELAAKFQADADLLMDKVQDDPELFSLIVDLVAKVGLFLERAADSIEKHIGKSEVVETEGIALSTQTLDDLVKMASALDASGDEDLIKEASVLDEILLTIGAPKNAVSLFRAKEAAELEDLSRKYRGEQRDAKYIDVKKQLDEQAKKADITKAIKDQVKEFRALEAPLQTRYCPDHPGVMTVRVGDRVVQCPMDKKMYNWETGFVTEKGNKVPGGGVEFQLPDWNSYQPGHVTFDTRENLASRVAGLENKTNETLIKLANNEEPQLENLLTELEGYASQILKLAERDYEYGVKKNPETGERYIEVKVRAGTDNARKLEIKAETEGVLGTLYPIIFSEEDLNIADDFEEEDDSKWPVELSYADLNVFSTYHRGQSDPLYAVLSRRGNNVDFVTVDASGDELERLLETAEDILQDGESSDGERNTAEDFLARNKKRLVRPESGEKSSDPEQGNWVSASGGKEEPFRTRTGRRLQYVWQPSTGRHAYLDLGTDLILSDEEAREALGI